MLLSVCVIKVIVIDSNHSQIRIGSKYDWIELVITDSTDSSVSTVLDYLDKR